MICTHEKKCKLFQRLDDPNVTLVVSANDPLFNNDIISKWGHRYKFKKRVCVKCLSQGRKAGQTASPGTRSRTSSSSSNLNTSAPRPSGSLQTQVRKALVEKCRTNTP